jgi:hypothetical protein
MYYRREAVPNIHIEPTHLVFPIIVTLPDQPTIVEEELEFHGYMDAGKTSTRKKRSKRKK